MEEKKAKAKAERKAKKAENKKNGIVSEKKRKRNDSNSPDKPANKKVSSIQSSAAAAVMGKVAQELAEKKNNTSLSNAVKSIYGSKDKKETGNFLTKGTFNRY